VKWVNGFEVIGANTVNKDYYERLLKEKNEKGIGLHEDNIEEIERKKAINQMAKLQNLTNRKKAQRRQIRKEEEDIMYQYLSAEYCPF
jgi:6-phosphofructokinase